MPSTRYEVCLPELARFARSRSEKTCCSCLSLGCACAALSIVVGPHTRAGVFCLPHLTQL
jgi:hypothetical protein